MDLRNPTMGVTIKDVAKKSGVSVTTVSLVLNKKSNRISEKTRQLIEDAARELNFIPNHNAVSLVTKKSKLIALLLPGDTYYQYDDFIRSMEYACRNAGYSLIVSLTEHTPEDIITQIHDVLRYNVEGIVIDPSLLSEWSDELQKEIDKQDIPIILTGPVLGQSPVNSIMPAHRRAAYSAVKHLIELGHERIGLITGPDTLAVTVEMIAGYRAALEENHISFSEDLIYCGPYHPSTGKAGIRNLKEENISAALVVSESITFGAMYQLSAEHIKVPDRFSLISYAMGSAAETLDLPITSVSIHLDRIARKSVNLIRNYSGETSLPESVEPTIIDKGSTAPYTPDN